jgi:hypothetical protein
MNGDDRDSEIIAFYKGEPSSSPYSLAEILEFTDSELEIIHNHIQWLFPTNDPRNKDTGKPFLTNEDILEFKNSKELQDNLWNSYDKMILFYGFCHNGKGGLVTGEDFKEKSKNWLNKRNHNYLRLTRMISCLKSVGLDKQADALYNILCDIYKEHESKIGSTTMEFWKKAIDERLYEGYVNNTIQVKELKDKLKNINWS